MISPGAGILEMVIEQTLDNSVSPRRNALVYILVSVAVAFISLVYFSIAFFTWLLTAYALPKAAVISACVFLALSFLGLLTASLSLRRRARLQQDMQANLLNTVMSMAGDLEAGLQEPVRENPKTALLLAAMAGFFVAEQSLNNR